MNYRHAYHAGNFADVIKHVLLIGLLQAFQNKDTPYCYIDTHAGIGYYDLFSEFAKKSHEYTGGIEKIIQADTPPPLVKTYLDCVHRINNELTHAKFASLRYYPGSPLIARYLGRPKDTIIACELQPQEYSSLRETFSHDRHVAVHHLDGFLGLKAFLPPRERRGLILIDPPYENTDEFTRIAQSLNIALKRFPTGTYAIWYPIKEKAYVERFYRALKAHIPQEAFVIELCIYPDLVNHLNGCGLAIINPPWKFEQTVNTTLPWLWKTLSSSGQGSYRTTWLK